MKRLLSGFLCLSMLAGLSGCTGSASSADDLSMSTGSQSDQLWTYDEICEGIQADTSLLSSSSSSIRFWIRPEENFPNTAVFFAGTEEDYLVLTTSGYSDGVYSGLTLCRHRNGTDEWLVADGDKTLQTSRYNYVVINRSGKNTEIWLNNEKIASGKLSGSIPGPFRFGSNPLNLRNEKGRYADLTLSRSELSAAEIAAEFNAKYGSVLLDTIQFPEADDQMDNLWLENNTIDGVDVRWTVDPQDVMNAQGIIQTHDKDETVHLHAVIDNGTTSAQKDFEIQIKGGTDETRLSRDEKALDADINGVIFSGSALPQKESSGSTVIWSVKSGAAEIQDGTLVKTGTDERPAVTIEAILQYGQSSAVRDYTVVLLDPIGGYVMSYFNGDLGSETGRLAASSDGLHWSALSGSEITSSLGTGRVRDPSISRARDGSFLITATEGYDNPSVYLIQTNDLLDFTRQSLIQIAAYDKTLQMSGNRAWGPELIYDNEKDQYVLYFADTAFEDSDHQEAGGIYAVTSSDLISFSYPRMLFNPGYPVIDGTILTANGSYWMLYKDERKGAQTVYYASAGDLDTGFHKAYDDTVLYPKRYIEGPMVFPLADGSYCLYVDYYPSARFYVGRFTQLGENPDITWYSETDYALPEQDVRNGSVIPVTAKEYERILEHYS